MKPITPYQRLLGEIRNFCFKLMHLEKREMWYYTRESLKNQTFHLGELCERTAAADQLGYEVILIAKEGELRVFYRKKLPEIPYRWRL